MTDCCGKARSSRFCPDCGKQLDADPIMGLLKYLRDRQRSYEKRLDSLEKWAADNPAEGLSDHDQYQKEKDRDGALLWKSRAEALVALLDGGPRA